MKKLLITIVGVALSALIVVLVMVSRPTPSMLDKYASSPSSPSKVAETTKAPTPIQVIPGTEIVNGFPTTVQVVDEGKPYTLHYTGQFTRKKNLLVVSLDLYAIASYAETLPTGSDSEQLLDNLMQDGPRKVYLLRFVRGLPGKQVMEAINYEIETYFGDVDMEKFGPNMARFTKQFGNGGSKGDTVYMAWLPGGRVLSSFNKPDDLELVAQDVTVSRAIWRIWAGHQSGDDRFGLIAKLTPTPK